MMLVMTPIEDDERPDAESKERLPLGELRPDDRGQDEVREELEESIGRGEARPLTREEREAAARDPGPAKTVYAPASERVPKPPLPGGRKTDRPAQGFVRQQTVHVSGLHNAVHTFELGSQDVEVQALDPLAKNHGW